MNLRIRQLAVGAAASACCVLACASFAGDKAQGEGASAAEAEMMARCMEYAAVNENHEFLAKWEGEWTLELKHWMDPNGPPETSAATASSKMAMDGHYLIEKVRGRFEMEGVTQEFEGMGVMGYDNHKEMYFSTWFDNMGSGMMQEWGTRQGDKLVTKGENYNPMFGSVVKTKSVATVTGDDTRMLEMFTSMPDGTMFKMMEITYTRK